MGAWKQVYARQPDTPHDTVEELRRITDPNAKLSVPMILDDLEGAAQARVALAAVFDEPDLTELTVYTIGDGGAMSGILLAGRRPVTAGCHLPDLFVGLSTHPCSDIWTGKKIGKSQVNAICTHRSRSAA